MRSTALDIVTQITASIDKRKTNKRFTYFVCTFVLRGKLQPFTVVAHVFGDMPARCRLDIDRLHRRPGWLALPETSNTQSIGIRVLVTEQGIDKAGNLSPAALHQLAD